MTINRRTTEPTKVQAIKGFKFIWVCFNSKVINLGKKLTWEFKFVLQFILELTLLFMFAIYFVKIILLKQDSLSFRESYRIVKIKALFDEIGSIARQMMDALQSSKSRMSAKRNRTNQWLAPTPEFGNLLVEIRSVGHYSQTEHLSRG